MRIKGFSAPIIEALAFFIALSFVFIVYNIRESYMGDIYKIIKECEMAKEYEKICYEGYISLSAEELSNNNITVVGKGSYGVIYLNNEGKMIARLR